jgi:hypothetical protein
MNKQESDEDREKRKRNIMKAQITGSLGDVFSFNPALDKPLQYLTYNSLNKIQSLMDIPKEERHNIYPVSKEDWAKQLGVFGIPLDRAMKLVDLIQLSSNGKFEDDYGKTKYISKPDQEQLSKTIPLAVMSDFGLTPLEVNTVIAKMMQSAEKHSSNVEGGKSERQLQEDENKKREARINKENKESENDHKVEVLNKIRRYSSNKQEKEAADELIEQYSMTDEEKKKNKEFIRRQREQEKEQVESLLGEYKTKEELKKYNPSLYKKNFGERSDYYKEHEWKSKVAKKMNSMITKEEDVKHHYTPKSRKRW